MKQSSAWRYMMRAKSPLYNYILNLISALYLFINIAIFFTVFLVPYPMSFLKVEIVFLSFLFSGTE